MTQKDELREILVQHLPEFNITFYRDLLKALLTPLDGDCDCDIKVVVIADAIGVLQSNEDVSAEYVQSVSSVLADLKES
jgi:hypothetical protein